MTELDFKAMSHQYFYENYFLINGEKPPPLSDYGKRLFAFFDCLEEGDQFSFGMRRQRGRQILLKCKSEKRLRSGN